MESSHQAIRKPSNKMSLTFSSSSQNHTFPQGKMPGPRSELSLCLMKVNGHMGNMRMMALWELQTSALPKQQKKSRMIDLHVSLLKQEQRLSLITLLPCGCLSLYWAALSSFNRRRCTQFQCIFIFQRWWLSMGGGVDGAGEVKGRYLEERMEGKLQQLCKVNKYLINNYNDDDDNNNNYYYNEKLRKREKTHYP